LLARHDAALQTCVYCPKLCRAACPVSQAEGSETHTPWGKISLAYFLARHDIALDQAHAAPVWACTRCHAGRERCEHGNEVAAVLTDARSDFFAAGAAPLAMTRLVERFPEVSLQCAAAADSLQPDQPRNARTALLVGCSYLRRNAVVARAALRVVEHFIDGPVRLLRRCCGLPLRSAGDRAGFATAADDLLAEARGADRLVVVDPGCAHTLAVEYPRIGRSVDRLDLWVDLVAARLERLPHGCLADRMADRGPYRYHDPCKLGRGLGRYEQPRRILEHLFGAAPAEFQRAREQADCSGAGGLLAVTQPATSQAIAAERVAAHRRLGGGKIVTACGESLRRFAANGAAVVDLMTLVADAITGEDSDG